MRSFTVTLLGTPIAVDTDPGTIDDSLHAHLRKLWGHCVAEEPAAARVYVALGLSPVPPEYTAYARAADARALAGQLSDILVGTAVSLLVPAEAQAGGPAVVPPRLGVYAGAVADQGAQPARAVALLGDASALGGGHRTAVMAALAERFAYLSDAAIAVDVDTGHVVGAAKPLSSFKTELLRSRWETPLDEVGLRPVSGPAELQALAFLERREDAVAADWEPLSVPEATARLAPAVPYFPALPRPMQDLAGLVAMAAPAVRIRYGDESLLSGLLAEVLAAEFETDLVIPVDTSVDEASVPKPGAVRRLPVLDGVTDGSTMALCRLDRTPLAIAGIAPHLWDLTRSWIGLEELTEQVTTRLGVPEDADPRHAVSQAVEQLVDEKVMARLD